VLTATGTNGASAYIAQRQELQGIESPAGSGQYPEPTWLGMIQCAGIAKFAPDLRHFDENGGSPAKLWEQEVPGSNPGAPSFLVFTVLTHANIERNIETPAPPITT
jgi:hypothetical protein